MAFPITDRVNQNFWHVILSGFFVALVVCEMAILQVHAYRSFATIDLFDMTLITLATWRLIRLFVYDKIMSFFRDLFYNVDETGVLIKPKRGFRRAVIDLLTCPWCFGVWATTMVVFFYFLSPFAFYPIFILAISVIATTLQIIVNAIGWTAEKKKRETEQMESVHVHKSGKVCETCE